MTGHRTGRLQSTVEQSCQGARSGRVANGCGNAGQPGLKLRLKLKLNSNLCRPQLTNPKAAERDTPQQAARCLHERSGLAQARTNVVTCNLCNPQTEVAEDAFAASALGTPVLRLLAPSPNAFFVSPKRKREHFLRVGQAAKSFNRQKAVDLFQQIFERRRVFEVLLVALLRGLPFKNDSDQRKAFGVFASRFWPPSLRLQQPPCMQS